MTVKIFDGVGRVDHAANGFRIFVHGCKRVPVIPPGFDFRRIFRAPDAFQLVQRLRSGLLGRGFANGLERSRERFNVPVGNVSGGTADLMDDAALDFRFREGHSDGF